MTVQLETERLRLAPYHTSQAERVKELAGDADVAATTFVPHPYTIDIAKEWIESHKDWIAKGKAYPLAMVTKEENELVGTMTLRVEAKHHKGELAYWVGKPYWGQGYATEAAKRVIEFGFEELDLHKIYGAAITTNPASSRIMQKVGMEYEGTLKEDILHWGEYKDLDMYGLINSK